MTMSNYPPGVSGREPEIAGPAEEGGSKEITCPKCKYKGALFYRLNRWDPRVYECNKCDYEWTDETSTPKEVTGGSEIDMEPPF